MLGSLRTRSCNVTNLIRKEDYPKKRERFVTDVVMPCHYLWLPNLKRPHVVSKARLIDLHDTMLSGVVFFSDRHTNHKQSLSNLLNLRSPHSFSYRQQANIVRVWRDLAALDLDSPRAVRTWLAKSIPLIPTDIAESPVADLCPPQLSYLTMLLMLASYGEYPLWISDLLWDIKPSRVRDHESLWVKRYMVNVRERFEALRKMVNIDIQRSMDPIDFALHYMARYKDSEPTSNDSRYNSVSVMAT